MEVIGPACGAALSGAIPELLAQMEAEFEAANVDRAPESEVPGPA